MASNEVLPQIPGLEMNEFYGTSPPDSQELHVLAVDDSLVDRKVIERLLKISSCKVTAVDSGTRALQFLGLDGEKSSEGFSGMKVNMIITDYCMPGMNGYELLKKIKGSSTFREIPVVIMSSENVLPRIDRCLEEGAEEFIVKPVKLSDVKRLKDYLTRTGGGGEADARWIQQNNKRKLQESTTTDLSSLSSSSPSSSPSPSPSSSPSSPASPASLSMMSTPSPPLPESPESSSRRIKTNPDCES